MDQFDFWRRVRALDATVPGSVTRYWSTPAHNAKIGGAPESWHCQALAVDLVYDTPEQLAAAFQAALALDFPGIELDLDNQHLHVDGRDTPTWHVIHQHGTSWALSPAKANGTPPSST